VSSDTLVISLGGDSDWDWIAPLHVQLVRYLLVMTPKIQRLVHAQRSAPA
jgi:hypothetical protein